MKKLIKILLVVCLLIISSLNFDTVKASEEKFTSFPSKTNVSLEKMWTVTFSREVTMDEVEGVVVQKGLDFIPTNISIVGKDKILVKPIMPYAPSSKHTIKLFLKNGKKYKMDFTTENSFRKGDTDDDNIFINANPINLGDKLTGSFIEDSDEVDWYKLYVSRDSNVNLSLKSNEGKDVKLYLYSKDGDSHDYLGEDHWNTKSVRYISEGLSVGTYYIKVTSDISGSYNLVADYENQDTENDIENNDNYVSANNLKVNESLNGHIGNLLENGARDTVDFYKFTLAKDGVVNVKLNHNNGKDIKLYLYGKDGDNYDYIEEDHWNSKSARYISAGLAAGEYYVKITSENYGTYTLNSTFTEDALINDREDNDLYLNAVELGTNETKAGHIGYLNENNGQDKTDWYKLTLASDKDINLKLSSKAGIDIKLYLYGEDGDNYDYLAEDHWNSKSERVINKTLSKGIYYVKIQSDEASGYTLKAN